MVGGDDACVPAWGAAAAGWTVGGIEEPDVGEHPGDDGVGVPHLAEVKFVASPHGGGNQWNQIDGSGRHQGVAGELDRTADGMNKVWDFAVGPPADLVAEDSPPAEQSATDRPFGDGTARVASMVIRDGSHLDRDRHLADGGNESGMVNVTTRSPRRNGRDRLVQSAAGSHYRGARAEWDPVELKRARA